MNQMLDSTLTSQRQMTETGTLGKGKEAVNKDMLHCVCYNSGKRKWQKNQIHIRVYILLTTEIYLC